MYYRKISIIVIVCLEITLVVLFATFTRYDPISGSLPKHSKLNISDELFKIRNDINATNMLWNNYPFFQDIHIMVFLGFGFLMTFLRRYAYGAIGFSFFLASLVVQWAILCQGFFTLREWKDRINVGLNSLIKADETAATILISLGAVLGKITPLQMIAMALIETPLMVINAFIGEHLLEASDVGGSMFIHTFGAYFGLAVSFILGCRDPFVGESSPLESSTYQNDIFSMIGSLFLWLCWPSFNSATLSGDEKYRAIINTYLALSASCLVTFAVSSALNRTWKLEMIHIQNAILAGGVCVGTAANMVIFPYGALLIGGYAGILCTIGFRFVQEFILRKGRIHDTCGVNNLHGMPGITGGLVGALMSAMAVKRKYGTSLLEVFPLMGPPVNRTRFTQAGFQLASLVVTLLISIPSGLLTGLLLKSALPVVIREDYLDDAVWWEIPGEETTKK